MGRQILLHLAGNDEIDLYRYVHDLLHLSSGLLSDDVEDVEPLSLREIEIKKTNVLWSSSLIPDLKREWIADPGYYRVDTLHLPVMEFNPCFQAKWEGKPALCQGRVFGNFEPYLQKSNEFLKSFNALSRWVKDRYEKNPFDLGGYVGPSAWEFHKNGGYLLPSFIPPRTPEWQNALAKQHPY